MGAQNQKIDLEVYVCIQLQIKSDFVVLHTSLWLPVEPPRHRDPRFKSVEPSATGIFKSVEPPRYRDPRFKSVEPSATGIVKSVEPPPATVTRPSNPPIPPARYLLGTY